MRVLTHPVAPEPGRRRSGEGQSTGREQDGTVSDQDVHVGVLVRTIEHEIIPRLMLAHRAEVVCLDLPEVSGGITATDVESFVKLVLSPDESLAGICVQAMRASGRSAEDICLALLAPVARRLGELWEQDLCDFTDVTFGLGRLHHILRDLSASFERPQDAPANGRRILLLPAPGEQHTFGLMMVAEFFRHEGWDVEVSLGEGEDAAAVACAEWFDVVGFTAGVDTKVQALTETISRVRARGPNSRLCIMVGGPLFLRTPELAQQVGADGMARDGRSAPAVAVQLVSQVAAGGRA